MTNSNKKSNSLTKKIVSLLMAVIMCVTMLAGSVVSAQASYLFKNTTTLTGNVNERKGNYIDVYTTGKAAKLRVCTFTQAGKRTSGELKYQLVSDNGGTWNGTITGCNGLVNTTSNISLPKGNTHYKVYLWRASSSSKNKTNTFYLSVDFMSNCWR